MKSRSERLAEAGGRWAEINMLPEEQEALSRRYCNEVIILLPLTKGGVAVFNAARDLCGIVDRAEAWAEVWYAPKRIEAKTINLEELGLL